MEEEFKLATRGYGDVFSDTFQMDKNNSELWPKQPPPLPKEQTPTSPFIASFAWPAYSNLQVFFLFSFCCFVIQKKRKTNREQQ